MIDMATFIALAIMKAADVSLQAGQDKYRAYFIHTSLYAKYKADVDTILMTDPNPLYAMCIVSE